MEKKCKHLTSPKSPCVYSGKDFEDIIVKPNLQYSAKQGPKGVGGESSKTLQQITTFQPKIL